MPPASRWRPVSGVVRTSPSPPNLVVARTLFSPPTPGSVAHPLSPLPVHIGVLRLRPVSNLTAAGRPPLQKAEAAAILSVVSLLDQALADYRRLDMPRYVQDALARRVILRA